MVRTFPTSCVIALCIVNELFIHCLGRRDRKQIDEDMQNYINEARYIWTGFIALLAFRNESKNHPVGNEVSTSSNLPTATDL